MFSLALLWICWCALHSLLITGRVNEWIQKKGGFLQGTYRIFYILFSIVSLPPILWYQYSLPQKVLFTWQGWWQIPRFILLLYAAVLFWYGKKNYDMNYFLGIRQWREYRRGGPPEKIPFHCSGILQYVRHPWYSGGLALLWSVGPLTNTSLIANIILSIYLIIGTLLEEQKLRRELGEKYCRYCHMVPMFVPWKGKVKFSQQKP